MSFQPCCVRGFQWDGTPTGRTEKLAGLATYVAQGTTNPDWAILYVHDLLGWTFRNNRLLADHIARETGATVYVPDFFDGEVVDFEAVLADRWQEIDLAGMLQRHARNVREPSVFAAAKALRDGSNASGKAYKKVGAVGYCYGGWAVLRLAAREHEAAPLVDAASAGQPSLVTEKDIDEVSPAVPLQLLAPERDMTFDPLKSYAFETLQKNGVAFDYQHFPGVEHGCLCRGDEKRKGEREAMVRGKNAVVTFFLHHLSS